MLTLAKTMIEANQCLGREPRPYEDATAYQGAEGTASQMLENIVAYEDYTYNGAEYTLMVTNGIPNHCYLVRPHLE